MRQAYTEADASNLGPEAFALSLARIRASPNFGPFPAPSLKETVMFPGPNGGMEWGGGAATPSGVYFVNVNEIPWIRTLVEARRNDGMPLAHGEHEYRLLCASCHGLNREGNPSLGFPSLVEIGQRHSRQSIETILRQGGGMMPPFDHIRARQRQAVVDYVLGVGAQTPTSPPTPVLETAPRHTFGGWRKFLDREGYPAIRPPWGTLNAVDLNTGEIKWQVPLGEHPELTARGIPPTGTENFGGPIATAGGLLFIAATADRTVRAFDQETGEIVWQRPLPLSGVATPATYSVKGRQYVVISAGGSRWGGPVGGYIVAFALAEGAGG